MNQCEHKHTRAICSVASINNGLKYMADLSIKCIDCNVQFAFKGMPTGVNLDSCTTSFDKTEARLAIEPLTK